MPWTAGRCQQCSFRLPYAVVTAFHRDGATFDFALCGECLCDFLQDHILGESSQNPVLEVVWRKL